MRRTIMLLTVGALMVAMMVASAMPAFAAAPDNANCIGRAASNLNYLGRKFVGDPSLGGDLVSNLATNLGEGLGDGASSNCA